VGDDRWLVDDVARTLAHPGELGQGAVAGAAAGDAGGPLDLAPQRPVGHLLAHPVDVQAVEGPGQQRLAGQVAELAAVGRGAAHDRVLAGVLGQAVLAPGDPDAGRQPPHVPFPRAGVGLVEVVEVEDQVALRRGVEAEVAKVGVAADDRLDAGAGQGGEVLGHERGPAAQERVRRGHHAPDAKGDQAFEPAGVRLLDEVDRVGPVLGRAPFAHAPAGQVLAQGAPGGVPLLARRQRCPHRVGHAAPLTRP
jgi:hypothetical protein